MPNTELDRLAAMFWQDMLIDWVNFSELVEWVREVPPYDSDRSCLERGVEYVFKDLLSRGATAWTGHSEQPWVRSFPTTEPNETWTLALTEWRLINLELHPGHVGMLRRVPKSN